MQRKRLGIRNLPRGAKNTDWGHVHRQRTQEHSLLEPAVTSHELSRATRSRRVSRPRHSGRPKRTAPGRKGSSTGLLRPAPGRGAGRPRSHSHLYRRALLLASAVSQEWVVETCCAPYVAAVVRVPASSRGMTRLSHLSISVE